MVPAFKQNTTTGYAQKASLFLQRYLQKVNGAHLVIICGEEKPSAFPMLFKQFYNCDIDDSSLPPVLFVFFHKTKELKPLMESGMAKADILQSKHCRKASGDFLPYSLLLFAFCASSIPSHFKCFCFTVTTNLSLYLQSPNDCTSYFIPYFLERVSHFPLQLMQLLVRPAFAFFLLFLLLLLPFIMPNSL